MKLRKASEADFSAIKQLIAQYPDVLVQDYLPDLENFFVAEEGDIIVGCFALEIHS